MMVPLLHRSVAGKRDIPAKETNKQSTHILSQYLQPTMRGSLAGWLARLLMDVVYVRKHESIPDSCMYDSNRLNGVRAVVRVVRGLYRV